MRLHLLAFAVGIATALASAAHASHYPRTCGGQVDTFCQGRVCPMDCFVVDCELWIDLFHDPFTAVCV